MICLRFRVRVGALMTLPVTHERPSNQVLHVVDVVCAEALRAYCLQGAHV